MINYQIDLIANVVQITVRKHNEVVIISMLLYSIQTRSIKLLDQIKIKEDQ